MKQIRLLALFALLLLTAASHRAQSQNFGISHAPLGQEAVDPTKPKPKRKTSFGSISLFPGALFDIGGGFNTGTAGTQTLIGTLIDVELGTEDVSQTRTKGTYTVGAWYWGRNGNDLYEVHLRAATPKGFGLQVGYLNTTQGFTARPVRPGSTTQAVATDAAAVDLFLFYGISSYSVVSGRERANRLMKDSGNWNIEFGAGLFIDNSVHYFPNTNVYSSNATANYTFYVSGSLQLKGHLSLQATEWVLRDRLQELNRLTLGVGLSF